MNSRKNLISRRTFLAGIHTAALTTFIGSPLSRAFGTPLPVFQPVLGRPTKNSIAINLISNVDCVMFVEYGVSKTKFTNKTAPLNVKAEIPAVFEISKLQPDSKYFYRLRYSTNTSSTAKVPTISTTSSFTTAKSTARSFVFTLHGDTHPERLGKMYDPDLYNVTLKNISSHNPDFHLLLGDDFSIDPLIQKGMATANNVDKVYKSHRSFLTSVGANSSIFLVNGNHEQAAAYLLDGTATNPAILAGKSRLKYFALPAQNSFYSADTEQIQNLGLARDYYSWNWGDAQFITLDPYWHSKSAVDNVAGVANDNTISTSSDNTTNKKGGTKTKNLWNVGIGDEQYAWFKKTLENSKAKYIFVFTHHVLGTGRGAVEVSYNYEWGGKDPAGKTTFEVERPNWELPIHDLMVKHKVSILFQGHDHIFVTQERDGIIYQSVPNPADGTFSMFNENAYTSGIKAPNSGHIRVSVSENQSTVEYFLAARETDTERMNLQLAHSYVIQPRMV